MWASFGLEFPIDHVPISSRNCRARLMIKISSIHRMLNYLKPNKSKKAILFKYRELREKITG